MFWSLSFDFRLRWWHIYFLWGLWPRLSLGWYVGLHATSVALPYWTAVGMLSSGCLSSDFLSGVGPLDKACSQKWSHEWLVSYHQLLSLTGQDFELKMRFSLDETFSFCSLLVSHLVLSCPSPTWAFSALCSAPPTQAEGKYSLHVFGHQFCPEGVQLAPHLC
jgi:hypothetical protein